METWPNILPVWRIGYSSEYHNAVQRTNFQGKKTQRKISNRVDETVSASIVIESGLLPLFEYFVQRTLNQGQDKFTGKCLNNGLVEDATLQIVGGYNVTPSSTKVWNVTCLLRVYRDYA